MSGTYPPAPTAIGYFPAYNLSGWVGTPTATPTILTVKSGSHPAYFYAYKVCTIYMMAWSLVATNSTAALITVQPYGSLTAGGTAAALGTAQQASMPSSGSFVSHAQAQSLSMAVGSYLGIIVTSSVSTAAIWLNVNLWSAQAGT